MSQKQPLSPNKRLQNGASVGVDLDSKKPAVSIKSVPAQSSKTTILLGQNGEGGTVVGSMKERPVRKRNPPRDFIQEYSKKLREDEATKEAAKKAKSAAAKSAAPMAAAAAKGSKCKLYSCGGGTMVDTMTCPILRYTHSFFSPQLHTTRWNGHSLRQVL